MPLNDIIADVQTETDARKSRDDAPEDDRAPDPSEQQHTTMRTRPGLPPYLHHQSDEVVSALLTIGSIYSLAEVLARISK